MSSPATITDRLEALEAEVGRLAAIEDCKQLMGKYGYMLDKCYYDEIPDLFVPDAIEPPVVYHDGAAYDGMTGVRRFYDFFKRRHADGRNGPAPLEFVDHPLMQHVVTVLPGHLRAFGRVRVLVQLVRHKDKDGGPVQLWAGGIYENEYRRVEGRWLFQRLNLNIAWATPFDRGWALADFAREAPLRLYPEDPLGPDRFADHGAAHWPQSTATFPFHFAHPVTGLAMGERLPAGQDSLA